MKRVAAVCLILLFLLSGCGYTEADLDEARQAGYEAGYEEGFDSGCAAGYLDGENDWKGSGYESGMDDGYSNGVEDGYQDGYSDARYGIPNVYETDEESYFERYWQVYDPDTGELREQTVK